MWRDLFAGIGVGGVLLLLFWSIGTVWLFVIPIALLALRGTYIACRDFL
jgi:hypothetical protein